MDHGRSERHFFGVCDGHGENGHFVSGFLKINLPETFKRLLPSLQEGKQKEILEITYEKVSERILAVKHFDTMLSGSTAVSCFMEGNMVFVANVGDSRAIVVKRKSKTTMILTKALTRDHKVDDPVEKPRILAAGGRVDQYRGKKLEIRVLNEKSKNRSNWESIGANETLENE